MGDSRAWLDPKTQEILQPEPPRKIAPPTLPDYSLILLKAGGGQERTVRAVRRVNDCPDSDAREFLARRLPLLINPDLSYPDALLGQFEFVCCDAIAVFLASEVVTGAEPSYMKELFAALRQSDEFRDVSVSLEDVPKNEEGSRFLNQFLGLAEADVETRQFPLNLKALYKKARIMSHWAGRIGAKVSVTVDPEAK